MAILCVVHVQLCLSVQWSLQHHLEHVGFAMCLAFVSLYKYKVICWGRYWLDGEENKSRAEELRSIITCFRTCFVNGWLSSGVLHGQRSRAADASLESCKQHKSWKRYLACTNRQRSSVILFTAQTQAVLRKVDIETIEETEYQRLLVPSTCAYSPSMSAEPVTLACLLG